MKKVKRYRKGMRMRLGEVVAHFNVSASTVKRARLNGKLPYTRESSNAKCRFLFEDVEAWIAGKLPPTHEKAMYGWTGDEKTLIPVAFVHVDARRSDDYDGEMETVLGYLRYGSHEQNVMPSGYELASDHQHVELVKIGPHHEHYPIAVELKDRAHTSPKKDESETTDDEYDPFAD